jgi:hypothetical protein
VSSQKSETLQYFVALIALAGAAWTLLKFVFKPFVLWSHRELGKQAFAPEFAQIKANTDKVTVMHIRQEATERRVDSIEQNIEPIQRLPEVHRLAEQAATSSERTERAIETLSANVLSVTKEVSELRGAFKEYTNR